MCIRDRPFADDIGVEVRQGLEPVLVDQLVMQAGQVFGAAGSQHLRAGEEADGLSLIHIYQIATYSIYRTDIVSHILNTGFVLAFIGRDTATQNLLRQMLAVITLSLIHILN